jgi:hypothetical protein
LGREAVILELLNKETEAAANAPNTTNAMITYTMVLPRWPVRRGRGGKKERFVRMVSSRGLRVPEGCSGLFPSEPTAPGRVGSAAGQTLTAG